MHTDLIAAALAMAGMRVPSDSRIRDRIAMLPAKEKRQIDAAVDRAIDESAGRLQPGDHHVCTLNLDGGPSLLVGTSAAIRAALE